MKILPKANFLRVFVLAVLLVLLAACGGAEEPAPAAAPADTPVVVPTSTPTPVPPTPTPTPEPAEEESPLPTPGRAVEESPLPTPGGRSAEETSPVATPETGARAMPGESVVDTLVRRAKEQLVEEVDGVDFDEIEVVSAEAVEWPDAALGCPQGGMMYAQVITPGYQIVLEADGEEYDFHTESSAEGQIILCR
jgi:hypothetical protein